MALPDYYGVALGGWQSPKASYSPPAQSYQPAYKTTSPVYNTYNTYQPVYTPIASPQQVIKQAISNPPAKIVPKAGLTPLAPVTKTSPVPVSAIDTKSTAIIKASLPTKTTAEINAEIAKAFDRYMSPLPTVVQTKPVTIQKVADQTLSYVPKAVEAARALGVGSTAKVAIEQAFKDQIMPLPVATAIEGTKYNNANRQDFLLDDYSKSTQELDSIPLEPVKTVKADDWEAGGDLEALKSLTTSKPIIGTTGDKFKPTDILTKPWLKPTATTIETQGYMNVKQYHDDVVAQLPGLTVEAQDMITLMSGYKGIQANEVRDFLFSSGIDADNVTKEELLQAYPKIQKDMTDYVIDKGERLTVMGFTPNVAQNQLERNMVQNWLDTNHPEGKSNGQNEALLKQEPQLAMSIYLGVNKYSDVVDYLNVKAGIKGGTGDSGLILNLMKDITGFKEEEDYDFYQAPLAMKQAKLAGLIASGDKYSIPQDVVAKDILDWIKNYAPADEQVALYNYASSKQAIIDAAGSSQSSLTSQIWKAATSDYGSDVLGLVAAGASVVGGALVAGPAGAITAAGMSPFTAMEVKNYVGFKDQRTAAALTAAGKNPTTVTNSHDFAIGDIDKAISQLGFNQANMTIAEIEAEKMRIDGMIGAEKKAIEKDGLTLIAGGKFSEFKERVDGMKVQVDEYNPKVGITNPITGKTAEVSKKEAMGIANWTEGVPIAVKLPEGYAANLVGGPSVEDGGSLSVNSAGSKAIEIRDTSGKVVKVINLGVYDANTPYEVSFSPAAPFVPYGSAGGAGGVTAVKKTIYLEPGATLKIAGKEYTAGETAKYIDVNGNSKGFVDYQITKPGKDEYNAKLNFTDKLYSVEQPILKTAFTPYVAPKEVGTAFFKNIPEGAKLFVDGKEVDPQRAMGIQSKAGVDEQHQVIVQLEGYEDKKFDVFLKAGETQEVSLAPNKEEFVPYKAPAKEPFTPYGGGGGGSGDSGGYEQPAAPTTGKLIFGEANRGATIFLDSVESAPEIGTAYDLTPGYHSVLVKKSGYKDVTKSVYITAGETTEYNPAWETGKSSLDGGSSDTGILIFGPTLEGFKIMLDGAEVAPQLGVEYDVKIGYHSVVASKTGFKTLSKTIYVSATTPVTYSPAVEADTTPTPPDEPTYPNGYGGVKFGETLRDAELSLDGVAIAPEIGKAYSLSVGYHAVQVKKTGYKTIDKTIYISQGVVTEYTPALELSDTNGSGTNLNPTTGARRVTFTSNPEGAKIMIGNYADSTQEFTGQWTPGYVDLMPGLYKLRLYKSGYVDQTVPLWVATQSLIGAAALAAAQTAGVI